ncbi:hypothetical protein A3L11_04150 [Thermococcus siculi]|uniref:Condensin complex subunit 1 C-terminal domain-containing protein n=1 Tax=Thermococcus siculi TaxID=72803 RepID=A0A2Z2MRQ1_9EURY|nr:hypothetical protein [Thermococcus siculi]ASJ08466.1 hypothetical protein A3L11_04150 [Thermococcus siculi]
MDQIKEIVMSWRAMDAIDLVREDREVLVPLLRLLDEEDSTLRLRTLEVVEGILREYGDGMRKLVMKYGFESTVACLSDEDPRVVDRAGKVLSLLLRDTLLDEEGFLLLLETLAAAIDCSDVLMCTSFVDLLKGVETAPIGENGLMRIRSIATSGSLAGRLMALRVLVNMGRVDGHWRSLRKTLEVLLSSGNLLLIELAMDFLEEVAEFPGTGEMMRELLGFVFRLRYLEANGENVILRNRAVKVRAALENAISSYYRAHREEAAYLMRELLMEGRERDALFLAFVLGDADLMFRMWMEAGERPELMELLNQSQSA